MALRLVVEQASITTRHPFVIARGSTNGYKRAWVRLVDGDGVEGWGEADPSSFYGENLDTVLAAFEKLSAHLPRDPFDLETAEARWEHVVPKNGAARAALSAALHDLVGKRLGQRLWRVWGLDPKKAPLSSFTIGLDTAEKMREKVREAESYPILKIKLGTDRDEEILRTIRDATDKPIRVVANAGWSVQRARQMIPVLGNASNSSEQPLVPTISTAPPRPARRPRRIFPWWWTRVSWRKTSRGSPVASTDQHRFLAKRGSPREALRMIATARAHGMLVMVGCMIETSLASRPPRISHRSLTRPISTAPLSRSTTPSRARRSRMARFAFPRSPGSAFDANDRPRRGAGRAPPGRGRAAGSGQPLLRLRSP
jgi:hypothetical protein